MQYTYTSFTFLQYSSIKRKNQVYSNMKTIGAQEKTCHC